MSCFKSKYKNIKLFILLGHHMWFCYKNTLFNFKLKANTYPIKILSPVDDRNIYNNFLHFWSIHSLKSLFKQCCSMPELLISTSGSVPLVSLPTLPLLLSWTFILLSQCQWHQILYSAYEWMNHGMLVCFIWLILLGTVIFCSFHFT